MPKEPLKDNTKTKLVSKKRLDQDGTSTLNSSEKSDQDPKKSPFRLRRKNAPTVKRDPVPKKTTVKGSTTSLAIQNDLKRSKPVQSTRPKSEVIAGNVTYRRGQTASRIEDQNQDDLSRASSVSNLNAEGRSKGAKPRKAPSRERLDKIGERKLEKHERKGLTRNNNKVDSGDGYQEEAGVEVLRRKLEEMSNEKTSLALQLGEQTGHMTILQKEIEKLKVFQDESNQQLEKLSEENTALRNRLRDVAHSPLSDNEKQQLLFETQRHHSSAPASIASNLLEELHGGDNTACTTPEWDKHSSSNVSEISVACLQDKINQMQETHYSTNEELQATLQELTDLQRQLTELQQDNDRLTEEKTLMFDSLCRQTERLKETRDEMESVKQLLYKEKDEHSSGNFESVVEREKKLVELLKSAQEERESFLVKLEQLTGELQELRGLSEEKEGDILNLSERVKTLESILDAKHAEHKQLDQELALAKDQCSSRQIEINRLKDLLENARTKITELEQDRALSDKSELDELLDNARKEKDALESEVAHLKEQVARSKNETEKLKEQVSSLQEECKVTRNNAKSTQSDLEYKCEKLQLEKTALGEQLQILQEAVNELQVQSQCQLEDKRQLSAVLSETQRNLSETESKNMELMSEIEEVKRLRKEETEEWEKFQEDLLTSVRVANDFKTEAQKDQQKFVLENKSLREKVRQLEAQMDKLKAQTSTEHVVTSRPTSFPTDDFQTRRQKVVLSRQNSRQSVKSLIESIENAAGSKSSSKGAGLSRSSSSSSINSLASDLKSPASPSLILTTPSPGSPLKTPDWSDSIKTPLKEQQPNKMGWTGKNVITDSLNKADYVKSKQEDNFRESLLQKEFPRRNSYSDLSERKDPLNSLVKNGGSKRNALLKWCQNKCVGYRNTDITNFSSSWNDGLALCALLHTYLPDRIPYDSLTPQEKRRNFSLAFAAAESVGIPTTLNINDMIQLERPDWQQVMSYVTAIYKHFEA